MRFFLMLASATAILSACGGGGGSTPSGSSTPTAEPAALTQANYVGVAQEALSSSDYLTTATDFATGAQVSDPKVLIRFGQAQVPKLSHWFAGAPAQAVGVVTSRTESCAGGGYITISLNDLNGNNQEDVGDSASVTAVNCSVEGETLNGQLVVTLKRITGTRVSYPYAASIDLQFNNLVAQSASTRTVGNGHLLVSIEGRTANEGSLDLSTSDFSVASSYGGVAYSQSLSNYASSIVTMSSSTSASTSGTLTSSAFESKSIAIKTLVPFVRVNSQTYPDSGKMLITGAAGSAVRITATSATTVLIELDADGNGSYEKSTSKLWSEML